MENTTIRPPDDMKKQLKAIAKRKGQTLNGLILNILDNFLEKGGK